MQLRRKERKEKKKESVGTLIKDNEKDRTAKSRKYDDKRVTKTEIRMDV